MILLELTEKEAEIVGNALIKERSHWVEQDLLEVGGTVIENNVNLCHKVWAKIDLASQPQHEEVITFNDLFHLISMAKDQYHRLPIGLHISNKEIEQKHYVHISLANALIMWLNEKGLMKRLASFDYTDKSTQYETTEE